MRILLIMLLAIPTIVYALGVQHNKKPKPSPVYLDMDCTSIISANNKRIDIVCKCIGDDKILPGNVIELEFEINTSDGHPLEFV